jgi:hypothetical protein
VRGAARRDGLDLDLWLLAMAGDEIVGVCLCRAGTPEAPGDRPHHRPGGDPGWRRRGIALALLRTALGRFRERGLTGAALEVDDVTLDGAVALYQAAGLRVVRRTDVMEMRLARHLIPVPAGWRDPSQAGGVPGTGTGSTSGTLGSAWSAASTSSRRMPSRNSTASR